MKVLFQDKPKSYLLVGILGILAGLSVVFFCELPDNDLWMFYYWSSSTFGFWMFSTSLIVFTSENRKCGAVNAGIYIFLMFFITTMYMSFHSYRNGKTPFNTLLEVLLSCADGWLLYSIPPALVCAALGLVLWSGRKDTLWGKILQILPAAFILMETITLFYSVFTYHTKLFSASTDAVWLFVYVCLIKKISLRKS